MRGCHPRPPRPTGFPRPEPATGRWRTWSGRAPRSRSPADRRRRDGDRRGSPHRGTRRMAHERLPRCQTMSNHASGERSSARGCAATRAWSPARQSGGARALKRPTADAGFSDLGGQHRCEVGSHTHTHTHTRSVRTCARLPVTGSLVAGTYSALMLPVLHQRVPRRAACCAAAPSCCSVRDW